MKNLSSEKISKLLSIKRKKARMLKNKSRNFCPIKEQFRGIISSQEVTEKIFNMHNSNNKKCT